MGGNGRSAWHSQSDETDKITTRESQVVRSKERNEESRVEQQGVKEYAGRDKIPSRPLVATTTALD